MKNKRFKFIYNLAIFVFTLLLFVKSNKTIEEFNNTCYYIIKVIIPSLFPFIILVNFLLGTNCINFLATKLKFLTKIFKISNYGLVILLISLIAGYPYGSLLISRFTKENKITRKEAENLLYCTFFPSISFLFFTLLKLDSFFILNIVAMYLTSIIFLLFKKVGTNKNEYISYENTNFTDLYFKVMNDSFKSLSSIIFSIVFFSLMKVILYCFIEDNNLITYLSGIFEFSLSSVLILSKNNKTIIDFLLINLIINFSSFSIIFQSYYYLKEINISIKKLLSSRITISIISTILYFIIYNLYNILT